MIYGVLELGGAAADHVQIGITRCAEALPISCKEITARAFDALGKEVLCTPLNPSFLLKPERPGVQQLSLILFWRITIRKSFKPWRYLMPASNTSWCFSCSDLPSRANTRVAAFWVVILVIAAAIARENLKAAYQPPKPITRFSLGSYKGAIIFEDHTNEFWVNLGIEEELPAGLPNNIRRNVQVWVLGNGGAVLPFKRQAPPLDSPLPYGGSAQDRIVLGSMTFAFEAPKDARPEAAVLRIDGQYQVFPIPEPP